jgi:hypothetical protein
LTPPMDGAVQWLLDGDPAIRWQALRDLVGASERTVKRGRSKVAREGWGARLLAKQDPEGTWAGGLSSDGGLYSPKWTSTTYTTLLLRDFGLPANNRQARKACRLLLDRGLQRDGSINYGGRGRSETCDTIATHLLKAQMSDGGWNCRRPLGATHASMNTTISVLEGLRFLEVHSEGGVRTLRAAQRRGQEFLLVHRLFRSHRTGNIIKPDFTRFVFPPRWHHDILRALDYFQAVDAPRDPRLSEAIDIVRSRQRRDGRWSLKHWYSGKTYFALERIGTPSRWNTLRALRVLKWWNREEPSPTDTPSAISERVLTSH